ncbi:MAG: hypothetical protein J6Y29_00245 [Clostridiales bacterium]|nr:hypothetical protein [Clostridiales bacterium]
MRDEWKKVVLSLVIVLVLVFVVGSVFSFAFQVMGDCNDISHLSWWEGIKVIKDKGYGIEKMVEWTKFCFKPKGTRIGIICPRDDYGPLFLV